MVRISFLRLRISEQYQPRWVWWWRLLIRRDIVFDDEGRSLVQFYVEMTITVFTRHMEHDKIRLGIYGYYGPAIEGPL